MTLRGHVEAVLVQFPWHEFGVDALTLTRAIPAVAADLTAMVDQLHRPTERQDDE